MVKQKQKGFTLIEVVIAMGILAILALASSQSLQQAIRSKLKMQVELDEVSKVRDALRIIEKDINLAFHYQDLEKEFEKEVKKRSKKTPTAPKTPTAAGVFANPAEEPPEVLSQQELLLQRNRIDPRTYFLGSNEEMYFVTLNNAHLIADVQQADYVRVGYRLQDCKRPGKTISTKCLVRLSSPFAEGDLKENMKAQVLLENVTEFKLNYIGPGKQDWISTWDSQGGNDAAAKGKYPSLVEVNLGIEKDDKEAKKKVSMQIIAQVHFVNNGRPASEQK